MYPTWEFTEIFECVCLTLLRDLRNFQPLFLKILLHPTLSFFLLVFQWYKYYTFCYWPMCAVHSLTISSFSDARIIPSAVSVSSLTLFSAIYTLFLSPSWNYCNYYLLYFIHKVSIYFLLKYLTSVLLQLSIFPFISRVISFM